MRQTILIVALHDLPLPVPGDAHPPALRGVLTDGTRPFHLDLDAMTVAGAAALRGLLAQAYSFRWISAVEALMGYPIDQPMLFTYLPTAALVFAPLSFLSASGAFLVSQAVGLCSFVAALLWISPRRNRLALLFASLPIACMDLRFGQNAMLVAALTAVSAECWVSRRPWMAGLLGGLLILKPQIALGLPLAFAALRDWTAIAVLLLTSFVLVFGSVVVFGLAPWFAFPGALAFSGEMLSTGHYPLARFAFAYAAAYGLGLRGAWAGAAHVVILVPATAILVAALRRTTDRRFIADLSIFWGLFVSPYVYDYDRPTLLVVAGLLAPSLVLRTVRSVRWTLLAWAVIVQAMGLCWWILQGPEGSRRSSSFRSSASRPGWPCRDITHRWIPRLQSISDRAGVSRRVRSLLRTADGCTAASSIARSGDLTADPVGARHASRGARSGFWFGSSVTAGPRRGSAFDPLLHG